MGLDRSQSLFYILSQKRDCEFHSQAGSATRDGIYQKNQNIWGHFFSGSLRLKLEIKALYCTAPPLNWGHSAQNEQRITVRPKMSPGLYSATYLKQFSLFKKDVSGVGGIFNLVSSNWFVFYTAHSKTKYISAAEMNSFNKIARYVHVDLTSQFWEAPKKIRHFTFLHLNFL